jgi:hypothetical protein
MSYSRTFFRDRIILNNELKNRLRLDAVPAGGTILFAARELIVEGDVDLRDHPVVLLADRFDGSHGEIRVKGKPGPDVTLICRQVVGVKITSAGGQGAPGEDGEPGAEGAEGEPASIPNKPGGPGGRGGRGGPGQAGQPGGNGGVITIMYVEDRVPGGLATASLKVPGGLGGHGGQGGPGGPGGSGGPGNPDGPNGAPGLDGANGVQGPAGQPGRVQLSTLTQDTYWDALFPRADQWPAYRLRLAEYYFRAYNPAAAPASGYLALALSELEAVLKLDPQNAQAALYKNQIANNQNIFGVARDLDIIPDFEHYEQVLTQYGPLVLDLFQSATQLLTGNLTLDQIRMTLTREVAHIEGLRVALEAERLAADRNRAVAEIEHKTARTRLADTELQLVRRRIELEQQQISWGDLLTFSAWAVGTSLLMLAGDWPDGIKLLAALPDVMAFTDFGPVPSQNSQEILSRAKGLKELAEAKGDTTEIIKKAAIRFSTMMQDVDQAQANAEIKKLMKEIVELTHVQLLTKLRSEQAAFEFEAATIRSLQATKDLELARTQLVSVVGDVAFLETVALTLIRSAQRYMDVLAKYAFYAARSLEIYTLADLSNEIRYDYGYIHPDLEQDYQDRLLPLSQLIGSYQTSWSRFVGIVNYRNIYENYFGNGTQIRDRVFQSFTDQPLLDQFRETRNLVVPIELNALPAARFEAKVNYVLLSLTGATANAPLISCIVEHAGPFATKKRDGSTVSRLLRPRFTVIQTAKAGISGTHTGIKAADNPSVLSFWGRGIATTWNVSIEPDEMTLRQIDLSALSAIEVEIGYEAFLGQ